MKINDLKRLIREMILSEKENDEKEKIITRLIHGGFNKNDANKMVNKYYDYIVRVYDDKYGKNPIARKAEIISSLWSTGIKSK